MTDAGKDRPRAMSQVLPVLGAAAGIIALVYVLGGTILAYRFDAAGVSGLQAVALVDSRKLVATGVGQLIAPVVLFAAAVVLGVMPMRLFLRTQAGRRGAQRFRRSFRIVNLLGALFLFSFFILVVPATPFGLAWAAAISLVGLILFAVAVDALQPRARLRLWHLAAGALLIATLLFAITIAWVGGKMSEATVATDDGSVTRGIFVAYDSTAAYLGVDGDIVAIPASQIEHVRIHRPADECAEPEASILELVTGWRGWLSWRCATPGGRST